MPTVNIGKPGIFDQFSNTANTQELQARHGVGQGRLGADPSLAGSVARDRGLGAQYDALGMYRDQALGKGPSVAQQQMYQGLGQAQRGTLQAAAMGRGGNLAGMQQQALSSGAGMAAGANQQAAMMRLMEQQAGMQGYAGLGGQLAGQGFAYDQLGAQSALAADQNTLGWYSAERGMDMQQSQDSWNRAMGLWQAGAGALGGGVGAAAKMSDEQAKTDIRPTMGWNSGDVSDEEIGGVLEGASGLAKAVTNVRGPQEGERFNWRQFSVSDERSKEAIEPSMDSASGAAAQATPVTFHYKPGIGEPGVHYGFAAQDLERTPLGPSLVRNTPQGKMVDTGNAAMASLAGVAELRRELDAMKGIRSVPPTRPRERGQYDPDADMFFGDRMQQARAAAPPSGARYAANHPEFTVGGPSLRSRRTIDPFSGPVRGNVDLRAQPEVRNADGSISTVDSRSYNLGGQETVLPSVTPDGRHLQSDDDIVNEYRSTGRHLGKFDSVDDANRAAEAIHDDYARGKYNDRTPSPFATSLRGPANSYSQPYDPRVHGSRPMTADLKPRSDSLSPEQQQILDDFEDELDKWRYRDDATGTMRFGPIRRDLGAVPRGAQRYVDDVQGDIGATPTLAPRRGSVEHTFRRELAEADRYDAADAELERMQAQADEQRRLYTPRGI